MRTIAPLSQANLISHVVAGCDCKDLDYCVIVTKKNTPTANRSVLSVVGYYGPCLTSIVPHCKIKLKHFAVLHV